MKIIYYKYYFTFFIFKQFPAIDISHTKAQIISECYISGEIHKGTKKQYAITEARYIRLRYKRVSIHVHVLDKNFCQDLSNEYVITGKGPILPRCHASKRKKRLHGEDGQSLLTEVYRCYEITSFFDAPSQASNKSFNGRSPFNML